MSTTEAWSHREFSDLFEGIYPGLCRYLECMTGRGGAAQELAQEAMLRLFRAGRGGVRPGEERFWVYRVATNLALNELRRERTRRRLLGLVPGPLRPRADDPHALAERSERDRRLLGALARLPEQRRAALLLREQEGHSYAEIAWALGVTVAKVKVDIHRARAALREELAEPGEGREVVGAGGLGARSGGHEL